MRPGTSPRSREITCTRSSSKTNFLLSLAVEDALIFYAGVKEDDGALVTNGGRVMTIVGKGATYAAAIDRAYAGVSRVQFDGMQVRRDIGRKALQGRG